MKTLEKIIKALVLNVTEKCLDPLQFAYRAGRGVEDAKLFILNTLYKHLEKPKAHARLIFADFSSAFNLMQPHILVQKLKFDFNLPNQLVLWILDFLVERQQRVFVNGCFSDIVVTCTGSPQGCVLSPLLYILYTDSCRSTHECQFLVKFSDDSALLSLFQGPENDHGLALTDFVDWCDDNFLELNVSKTKEIVFDFRKEKSVVHPTVIHGDEVEIVDTYKYLGTVFDSQLKFDVNTHSLVKRGQQRIYLLRKLKSFSVDTKILSLFYQSFIESLLTFSFICWFHGLTVKDRNSLNSIVNVCSKIIGVRQRDLSSFCDQQILRKTVRIFECHEHCLEPEFRLLPSGRRYVMPLCKGNRRSKSFIPCAIRLLNS